MKTHPYLITEVTHDFNRQPLTVRGDQETNNEIIHFSNDPSIPFS